MVEDWKDRLSRIFCNYVTTESVIEDRVGRLSLNVGNYERAESTIEDGKNRFPRKSISNYHSTLHKSPEHRGRGRTPLDE
jgi:hypothetical protein